MRPGYPNDYQRVRIFRADENWLTLFARVTYYSSDQSNVVADVVPTDFEVELDANTLYEVTFGPYLVFNGDEGMSDAPGRPGAIYALEYYVDKGDGEELITEIMPYMHNRGAPFYNVTAAQTAYYFSQEAQTVKFGVKARARQYRFTPVGDLQFQKLPDPTFTTSDATQAPGTGSGTNPTQTRDAVLGNYTFTAELGRLYRVHFTEHVLVQTANSRSTIFIRDGGSSTPNTSSTAVAECVTYHASGGVTSRMPVNIATPPREFDPGTHTLSVFHWGNGTGNVDGQGLSTGRALYVEDVTPSGRSKTDAKVDIRIYGAVSGIPTIFGVRPVATGSVIELKPRFGEDA
jgi:hypothetical protein